MIEIPLTSDPEQLFDITLNGELYSCRVVLASRTGIWTISFYQNDIAIAEGISLLGGVDLTQQYNIPITNLYMVNLSNNSLDPSKDNFGTNSKLFILTDSEIEGITNG